ncbi:MAG TPA: site-2 protease family protein [Solirubrobacteraceae bacterium]|jgi:Zn-dependent protease
MEQFDSPLTADPGALAARSRLAQTERAGLTLASEPTATRPPIASHPLVEHDNPFGERKQARRSLRRRIGSAAAGAAALIAKVAGQLKGLILLLPKLKLLLTAGSAFVSIAAYSLLWGWQFAVGFVILLFVHEMGHVIQLRREGIAASAPTFVPFLGAVIASRSLGDDAAAEARVGLAGPILGTAGAGVCFAIAEASGSHFFMALAYVGFLLNLFNLLPVVPLDGGRAMAAMAPTLWFVGFAAIVAAAIVFRSPFMFLIAAFSGFELWRRWEHRSSRTLESAAYYRISKRSRLLVGIVYIGLVVLLAAGMHASYIARTIT